MASTVVVSLVSDRPGDSDITASTQIDVLVSKVISHLWCTTTCCCNRSCLLRYPCCNRCIKGCLISKRTRVYRCVGWLTEGQCRCCCYGIGSSRSGGITLVSDRPGDGYSTTITQGDRLIGEVAGYLWCATTCCCDCSCLLRYPCCDGSIKGSLISKRTGGYRCIGWLTEGHRWCWCHCIYCIHGSGITFVSDRPDDGDITTRTQIDALVSEVAGYLW